MGDLRISPRRSLRVSSSSAAAVAADVLEETAAEVLRAIQPTVSAERKRAHIISYVQRLLHCSLGCQVYPYGSVPLKTYLADGDIDLTVLSTSSVEEALISDIFRVLRQEELNKYAEFEIKEVQLISAEVKLVKCLIQDIVVDISCNQLGGLCTLCFLGQMDRLVDKDHLFKRSIILIKAWCYYESRILGATHGLFSTYALEILVLYIFQIHHSSLKGPFSVLHRFLDCFSTFDWENYCVSLHGLVRKSCLPDIVVHTPEVPRCSWLLSKEFLTNASTMFRVPPRDDAKQSRPFQQKFVNIIDPLKDDNNLGRSVNQSNFYRIRSAFKFGARKLGEILSLPTDSTGRELKNFFYNTLSWHGGRLQASSPPSDSSSICSFHSSDGDSSVGARSSGAETEGTADSSTQGSDAYSYQVVGPKGTDLTSDYDSHLSSLFIGQSIHGNAAFRLPMAVWDLHCHANYQPMWEQPFSKARGTGTYIPRTDLGSWRGGKLPVRKERKRTQDSPIFQSYNHDHKYGVGTIAVQENVTDQTHHQAQIPALKQSTASPVDPTSILPEQSEACEIISSENLPGEKNVPDEEPELNPEALSVLIPDQKLADTEETPERVAEKAYQLKDVEDFPPLSPQIQIKRSTSA